MAMERQQDEPSATSWGTLEELILVCAVNRHGTKSWDTIASELQNRTKISSSSSSSFFTPQLCKDKFSDLKRRFVSPTAADSSSSSSSSSLVDQLRKIRVEELRREVHQHDVSIVSLELKVKRLVEERERSLDLDDDQQPETVAGTIDGGDVSGGRSFNESNSTSQKLELIVKGEQNDAGEVKRKEQFITEPVEPGGENETDPGRTGNGPVTERKHVSDVQSSVSLTKKKWCSEGNEIYPAKKRAMTAVKPESMVRLLGIIRSHRLGSVFDRRQRSQESARYKNLIRQHMDLQRIQSRLDKGIYSDCSTNFFRDLLLLFNNMIVFHQKTSPERIAAQQLRTLVLKEMTHTLPKQVPPESQTDHLSKPNNKSSTIVPCSKRKAVSVPKNAKKERGVEEIHKANEKKVDDTDIRKKISKEIAISGCRNSLRTSSSKSGETNHENGGNELSSHDTMEMDTKKENSNGNNNIKLRKKQGAASFLKRMKQNEPSRVTEKGDDGDDGDGSGSGSENESKEDKVKGRVAVERVTRISEGRGSRAKRGVGRPPKAVAESKGKRGRENGDKELGLGGSGRARKRGKR